MSNMIKRLQVKEGIIDIVIDTDAYNEIDDQFAIVYALKSKERFNVRAIYACPFYKPEYNFRSISPEDGMVKSYDEIIELLDLISVKSEDFVYKGATKFMDDNKNLNSCDAVDNLINLVINEYSEEKPLTVVAIGALTNIALAISIEPKISKRINLVWLGGPMHSWNRASEFNLHQDITAARIVFESDVALTQVPCFGVTSHLLTNIYELEHSIDLSIEVNKKLVDSYRDYSEDHFAYSKEIWDIAPFAYLMNPDEFTTSYIGRRPTITYDETYSMRNDTDFMRVIQTVNRNDIYKSLFIKLNEKIK